MAMHLPNIVTEDKTVKHNYADVDKQGIEGRTY